MLLNHYHTLGVPPGERPSGIQHAVRDLARRCHPERTPPHGSRFFRAVTEALDVLLPASRRAAYDRDLATDAMVAPEPAETEAVRLSLMDDFQGDCPSRDEILNAFRCNFTRDGLPKSETQRAVDLTLVVDLRQPLAVVELAIPVYHPCPACQGTGHQDVYACAACDHGLVGTEAIVVVDTPRLAHATTCRLHEHGVHNLVLCVAVAAG